MGNIEDGGSKRTRWASKSIIIRQIKRYVHRTRPRARHVEESIVILFVTEQEDGQSRHLQNLLEGTVDGGAGGLALVEVDGGDGTLGYTFRSELEPLLMVSNFKI